jgi:ArsR family transcriptional regulator
MPDKSNFFSEDLVELAETAKALSHPARIAIIRFLNDHGPSNCTPIIDALPLSQPAVSRHLKELKAAGLLLSENCGNSVCYRINPIRMQKFCEVMARRCIDNENVSVNMFVSSHSGDLSNEPKN